MTALLGSLPSQGGNIYVVDSYLDIEENVCTKAQAVAIKEKGWTPYHCTWHNESFSSADWEEYEGCDDADGIIATEIDNNAGIDANAPAYDLNGKRVEDWQNTPGIYILGGKKVVIK